MGQEQFAAMMPYISADLVRLISEKQNISSQDAIAILYASKLYEALEKEETKVWQYSTLMLAQLFNEERAGRLSLPEV